MRERAQHCDPRDQRSNFGSETGFLQAQAATCVLLMGGEECGLLQSDQQFSLGDGSTLQNVEVFFCFFFFMKGTYILTSHSWNYFTFQNYCTRTSIPGLQFVYQGYSGVCICQNYTVKICALNVCTFYLKKSKNNHQVVGGRGGDKTRKAQFSKLGDRDLRLLRCSFHFMYIHLKLSTSKCLYFS